MLVNLEQAIQILKEGNILGMPTETVYGLASRIDSEDSIKKIFTTKQRPFFDPLIVHVSSIEQVRTLVNKWPKSADVLAKTFWPGPLTLVLSKNESVSTLITSGLQTVAIRMPRHPLALQLIEHVGVPLAAPSANKFGRTSPTRAEHVVTEFMHENIPVLDGGPCEVGIESTVLLIEPKNPIEIAILREGKILQSEICKVLQENGIEFNVITTVAQNQSPGHLKHHYMPQIPLVYCKKNFSIEQMKSETLARLNEIPDEFEGVKIRRPRKLQNIKELKLTLNPEIAARELYAKLREYSSKECDVLFFIEKPEMKAESWKAICDRLTKAASLLLE